MSYLEAKPLNLTCVEDITYNISKACRVDQALSARNNILHLYNQRGNNILVWDNPDENQSAYTYKYLVPVLLTKNKYIVFLTGRMWCYDTEPSGYQTLTVAVYQGTTATGIDSSNINIGEVNVQNLGLLTQYDTIQTRLDVSSDTTSSLVRFEISKPAGMIITGILIIDENNLEIDYDLLNHNRLGNIHDEGVLAITDAIAALKDEHKRILFTEAQNHALSATSWTDILVHSIPFLGKRYEDELSNNFKIRFNVASFAATTLYVRYVIKDINGTVQATGTTNTITSSGWKEISFSRTEIARNYLFTRYANLQYMFSGGGQSGTIDAISIIADH